MAGKVGRLGHKACPISQGWMIIKAVNAMIGPLFEPYLGDYKPQDLGFLIGFTT